MIKFTNKMLHIKWFQGRQVNAQLTYNMKKYETLTLLQENDTTMIPLQKVFLHKNMNLVKMTIFLQRMQQKSMQNQCSEIFS